MGLHWLISALFMVLSNSEIVFPEGRNYDFGKTAQNVEVFHEFPIENTSSRKIRIVEVSTACGCTEVEFPKELSAGEKGKIKVKFDAKSLGTFRKHVLVITSCKDQVHKLKISGEVVSKG
ncbi:DUF1573 domain-containing protein [Mongoliitalea lutea]|uniref:DUF1573 domain-containing protein n=1 Tax=Mongoliitalea lutea TaxID=849756 RepID=A0A8J3D1J6_9BACT|nr:DUF1573 domain-containing protein [Mongoliitalea lutea]GHB54077.1 hypothetical protein GCM10008106_37830 [Mongoliitalea lutea]